MGFNAYGFDPQGNLSVEDSSFDTTLPAQNVYVFDGYGNRLVGERVSNGSTTAFNLDPVQFGGQYGYYTDITTGEALLTHRYYDAPTGHFLNRDPIGYAGGQNLYAFCGNNPIMGSDPSGLDQYLILVHGTLGNEDNNFSQASGVYAEHALGDDRILRFEWPNQFGIGAAYSQAVKKSGQDFADFLEEVKNRPITDGTPNTIDVIGYSNGGNVATWGIQQADPGTVRRLIRLGTPTYGDTQNVDGTGTEVYNAYDTQDAVAMGHHPIAGLMGGLAHLPASTQHWHNFAVTAPPAVNGPITPAQGIQKHLSMNGIPVLQQVFSHVH